MTEVDLAALKEKAEDFIAYARNVKTQAPSTRFAEDVLSLLALLTETADALRAIVKIDAMSSYSSIYAAPGEMAAIARPLLSRLGSLTKENVNG